MPDYMYEHTRRIKYDSGQFIPVCSICGRFVKADGTMMPDYTNIKSCKSLRCVCFTCAKRSTSRCCPGKIAKPDCEGIKFCPDYNKEGMKVMARSS